MVKSGLRDLSARHGPLTAPTSRPRASLSFSHLPTNTYARSKALLPPAPAALDGRVRVAPPPRSPRRPCPGTWQAAGWGCRASCGTGRSRCCAGLRASSPAWTARRGSSAGHAGAVSRAVPAAPSHLPRVDRAQCTGGQDDTGNGRGAFRGTAGLPAPDPQVGKAGRPSPCWKAPASRRPAGWGWPRCTRPAAPAPVRGGDTTVLQPREKPHLPRGQA